MDSAVKSPPHHDGKDSIIKTGYLLKYKTMKKKFFVLLCGSTGIATLEYYDSEKKFLSGTASKRAIQLNCCFNINKKTDTKHKYMLALYTRNDCFCIVLENEQMQEEWLEALTQLQPNRENNKSVPAFEHIWQVRLNSKGLGSSQNRGGNYQLCLTSKTVHLVKMLSEGDGDLEFPLSTIRRCGHSDCFFFMEVGRQAPTGSGELWMQVDDTVIAQNIHEATLNAMQSINQLEEMRPRSHSNNSNDSKSHRRTTGPSRRNRCDSMPAHITQSHINSDREDTPVRDEHIPHSPASTFRARTRSEGEGHLRTRWGKLSLMRITSIVRPRTASEGEFHYRGGRTPDSPSRSRQKFTPARSNSNIFRPANMFPKSVIKANSDSPPIPNSPLSESPQSFLETERYMSNQCHSPDGSMDEYSSSPLDSLHRYGRTPESPTPTPIREESFESDEYINMSPSASSRAMPVPRSSIGFEGNIFHYNDPPIVGAKQTSVNEDSDLYSPMSAGACETTPNPGGEKEVYMNMEPTSSKSRIITSNSLDVPTNHKTSNKDKLQTSSSQDEGYIMMVPKIDNKGGRRLSKNKKQSSREEPVSRPVSRLSQKSASTELSSREDPVSRPVSKLSQKSASIELSSREEPVSRPVSRLSQKSASTESQDSYMFMSPSIAESKDTKSQGKGKKTDNKDGKTSSKNTRQPRTNGTSKNRNNGLSRSKDVCTDQTQDAYVNVDFNSQAEKKAEKSGLHSNSHMRSKRSNSSISGKVRHTLTVTPQSGSQAENEEYTMMGPAVPNQPDTNTNVGSDDSRSRNNLPKKNELDKNENVQFQYMNINFAAKNDSHCNSGEVDGSSSRHSSDPSADYMNIGFRGSKSHKSPVVPVSPIVDTQIVDLTDCIKNMSFPSGGMKNLVDLLPGNGKTTDGLGPPSHHSSRRSSQTSLQEERELNYVDVDITNNEPSQSIDGQRSRSPFPRRSESEKAEQSITYSSIDFTKSEGLRTIQNLRESRF